MNVGGPQEVQLRVQVMEVQRSTIRRFGFNFAAIGRNAAVTSTPGPITPLSTMTLPFGGPPGVQMASSALADTSMALGIATDDFVFQGLLQALKEEGLLKIQAEPVLVTRSGEPARLINGGEFPIPVPQSLGTVTIEWREFGVTLESLPIVLGPTTLKQQIRAEVSERDFTTAVTLNGTTVPGLTKRTVETQAVMEFGQTLVIGGLISTRHTAETDKIPFLGELPGIGAAFRRVRYDTAETELLVLITPEYVTALSPDQVPHGGPGRGTTVPTDRELIGQGILEVPNYGDRCEGANCEPSTLPHSPPLPYTPAPMYAPPAVPGSPAFAPPPSAPVDSGEPGLIAPPGALPPPPGLDPATTGTQRRSGAVQPVAASRPAERRPLAQARSTPGAGFTSLDGLIEPAGLQETATGR
jgi:pilus assembly protein CpaC